MWNYVKKYLPAAVIAACFMIGEVVVDLAQPRLMAVIVDEGILGVFHGGVPDLAVVKESSVRMLLLVLCGGLCGVLSGVFTNICAQNCGGDLRKALFSRIMHLSFAQTDTFTTGSLITRTTSDVTQVQNMISQMIRGMVRCFMFLIGGTIALVTLHADFGRVMAVAIPLICLEIVLVMHRTNPLFGVLQRKLDHMNSVIQENIDGARVVKAFVQEDREQERFERSNRDLAGQQMQVLVLLAWLRPIMNIVMNLAAVVVIRIGAIEVAGGSAAPGTVIAGVTYTSQILNGMTMMAMIFQTISRGMASKARLFEVLRTDPSITDGKGEGAPAVHGKVELSHVAFTYPGRKEPVLKDVNITIESGETVALIGATGSGKSTLAYLIPRFYDATEGTVAVDGVDVRDWKLRDLRNIVAIALQKSELFATTIRRNIAMGGTQMDDEAVERAARQAQADDFIRRQSDGYDTPVAEQGTSLSGGQKQRVAIARALVHGGEILILDDATSALDLQTEAALYAELDRRSPRITRLVIAQRIATARKADRIAVLDHGTIVASGTHEQLLASCAVYREIYDSQMGNGGMA